MSATTVEALRAIARDPQRFVVAIKCTDLRALFDELDAERKAAEDDADELSVALDQLCTCASGMQCLAHATHSERVALRTHH